MPKFSWLYAACALLAAQASAGEVGNILVPESAPLPSQARIALDNQARAASAAALDGVQSFVAALQQSELRQIDDRNAKMQQANGKIDAALQQMRDIPIPEINIDSALKRLTPDDMSALVFYRREYLKRPDLPRTLRDLYNDFIEITQRLNAEIKASASSNAQILPDIVVRDAARFLWFGNLVSHVAALADGR